MRALAVPAAVFVLSAGLPCAGGAENEEKDVSRSVVKIFATHRMPDYFHPWTKQDAQPSSGTGVVIDGRRILTNSHVVQYSNQVFVQPYQSGDKIAATIVASAPSIDLALLSVADESFFEKHPPLARSSKLPAIKDAVVAYGYPMGGESMSITKGVVSRIEYAEYYYSTMGLRMQIDAAVNPGNSGGPATVGDKMVGLIYSKLQQSDNIGYIIPSEEIDLFLEDVADGRYDGKPVMDDVLQQVQNEALRRRLKLRTDTTGVMVWRPALDKPSYPLKRWDIITKIGDHAIDNAGMVHTDDNLHLHFVYFLQKLVRDGKVPLEIFRDGASLHVQFPVISSLRRPTLHPPLNGNYPSYVVWGPLVFSPATEDYLQAFHAPGFAEQWLPYLFRNQSPLLARYHHRPDFEGEQLVVVVAMLPHRLVKGYTDPSSCVVDEVDGVKIRNVRHLAERLRDAKGEFLEISFRDRYPDVFVFDRKQLLDASEEILADNGIRTPYSDDLKAVFRSSP